VLDVVLVVLVLPAVMMGSLVRLLVEKAIIVTKSVSASKIATAIPIPLLSFCFFWFMFIFVNPFCLAAM
jgi:hypothetical protein